MRLIIESQFAKERSSEKGVLAWILKDCVEEYRDCNIEDIRDKYIEGTPQISEIPVAPDESNASRIHGDANEDKSLNEGTIYYDIRFRSIVPDSDGDLIGLIINVEAQNKFNPGYPLIKRALYYCSRMISSQYGTEFSDPNYERIKKVYSIWVCMHPPSDRENTITRYCITEENLIGSVHEKRSDYDLLSTIMVCLGDPKSARTTGVLKLLSELLSNEVEETRKRYVLEDEFQIPMTVDLEKEVGSMCNLSDGVWEQAMEKGIKQGIEQGIEQGIQQGIQQGVLHSIENLMNNTGMSADEAMSALGVSPKVREEFYKKHSN